MIRKTFTHIPGIGEKKEVELWNSGVTDWEHLYDDCSQFFGDKLSSKILKALEDSLRRYEKKDLHHFYSRLPRKHLWRLMPGHEKSTAFVDIETTGLTPPPRGKVTTISVLLDGKLYQAHEPKSKEKLVKKLEDESKLIVSYYGEVFDLPFLRKQYKRPLEKAHVDLCFALRRHGLTGGLKVVEKKAKIGFKRKSEGLDGFAAVVLWDMFEEGDRRALETLLAYNGEDTLVLQKLAQKLFSLESKISAANTDNLSFPKLPKILFKAHQSTIQKVKSRLFGIDNLILRF